MSYTYDIERRLLELADTYTGHGGLTTDLAYRSLAGVGSLTRTDGELDPPPSSALVARRLARLAETGELTRTTQDGAALYERAPGRYGEPLDRAAYPTPAAEIK